MGYEEPIRNICSNAGICIGSNRPWDIKVHDERFFQRVVSDGSLGLGETYMLGWWDTADLMGFFERLLASGRGGERKNVGWRAAFALLATRLLNIQSPSQARQMADAHYNLSNELFEHMLGKSMAYSCGYWQEAKTLDEAQFAKYDLICRKLKLQPGERLLDVGCGWGGFARYASENYGVSVVGLTVARRQAEYARRHCSGHAVDIVCCDYREFDYRDHGKAFDKAASIGMVEHVGTRNYRTLFEIISRAMKQRGLFLLHAIGSSVSTQVGDPWLTTYIFPGGVLPSIKQLSEAAEDLLVLHDVQNIGIHYTPTLIAWHDNFERYRASAARRQPLPEVWGSSEAFCRMWRYYLLSCAAEFSTGGSQVWQQVFSKGHLADGYEGYRVCGVSQENRELLLAAAAQ